MAERARRERVLQATVRTLAERGFARTTARAIAGTGGFAPGVIYYHFADLDDVFVAALRHTSQARMQRYLEVVGEADSAVEVLAALRQLYDEDTAEGHIAAVQELVAAATGSPRIAEEVGALTAGWQDFAERLIELLLDGTALAPLVPVPELARTAVAAYLGMQMLAHLDRDDGGVRAVLDAAAPGAALLDSIRVEDTPYDTAPGSAGPGQDDGEG